MPRRMAKMPTAAKEPREQVKWIVRSPTRLLALAVLLDAFVTVLVVDFAERGCRQDVVRVGNFNELLARCFIAADAGRISALVLMGVEEDRTYGFLSGWYFLLSVR